MRRRKKTTQKICWAATRGTPCRDWRGVDLKPAWRVQTADGHDIVCCDAHLPEMLRECELPAEVHAAPANASIRPPSYKIHDPGHADIVGKEETDTVDLGPPHRSSSDP